MLSIPDPSTSDWAIPILTDSFNWDKISDMAERKGASVVVPRYKKCNGCNLLNRVVEVESGINGGAQVTSIRTVCFVEPSGIANMGGVKTVVYKNGEGEEVFRSSPIGISCAEAPKFCPERKLQSQSLSAGSGEPL